MTDVGKFESMLIHQQLFSKDKMKQYADVMDVSLQDMYADGKNKPGIETLGNGKFEIPAQIQDMEAYMGGGMIGSEPGFTHSTLEVVTLEGYFTITHQRVVSVVNKGASALVSATQAYLDGNKRSMWISKSRQLRGDGTGISGVLAAGVQGPTDTIVISDRAAGAESTQNRYGLGTRELRAGTFLVFGTKAELDAGTAVEAQVKQVIDGVTLKLTAAVTVGKAASANNRGGTNADTVYIVRGKKDQNEWKNSAMGIFGLVDDGTIQPTLQGITRADEPYMTSIVKNIANTGSIQNDLEDLFSEFTLENPNPKYFRMSSDVYRKYKSIIQLNLQTTKDVSYATNLDSGFTGISFTYGSKTIPVLEDKYLPAGQVFLLDPEMMFEASLFADAYVDGYIMSAVSGGVLDGSGKKVPGYETLRASYFNFGTYGSRKLGGKINYLTV